MEDAISVLPIIEAIVQWLIAPMVVLLWQHNRRHGEHEKKFIRNEAENRRILTILEERSLQRGEDNERFNKTLEKLGAAIEKLNDRLDRINEH